MYKKTALIANLLNRGCFTSQRAKVFVLHNYAKPDVG